MELLDAANRQIARHFGTSLGLSIRRSAQGQLLLTECDGIIAAEIKQPLLEVLVKTDMLANFATSIGVARAVVRSRWDKEWRELARR